MKLYMEIDCGNAAFEGRSLRPELIRLLEQAATQLKGGTTRGLLRDTNGNRVGFWYLRPADKVADHEAAFDD